MPELLDRLKKEAQDFKTNAVEGKISFRHAGIIAGGTVVVAAVIATIKVKRVWIQL